MPLAILFGALFTSAVSIAAGALLLGPSISDRGLRFVCGAAVLSCSIFLLCSAGAVYPLAFLALGSAILIAGFRGWPEIPRLKLNRTQRPYLLILAVYFLLYFFNSMAPEISFDGSRYHLGLVGRYLREHGFHPITDNMYASLSQGVEMLYLFAYAFGKHSAAAMVHFAFLLALAWLVFSYARRAGLPLAGACGSLLVFVSPIVGVDGTSAYNDVAVAAIAFALFYLLQIWDAERSPRLLLAIGLLAGFCFAAKYTAWLAVPYAAGFVAWKSRRLRDVVVVALCAAIMIAPWLIKNWLSVQNPVAPFFNHWFPNPYVTAAFEKEYQHHMAWYDLKSRWEIPLQLTVHGSLSGLFGPIFLLSPLALLALRLREGRQLLLAALVFGANYFGNIGARFLIPVLPFVALAMAMVLCQVPRLAMAVLLVHAVISWPSVLRRYCRPDAWRLAKVPYREALRIKPEAGYLESNLFYYGATRMVDEKTAPGATVFAITPIPEAYTSRKIQVAYQSQPNIISRSVLWSGFVPEYAMTWQLRFSFARRPLRAIRIVQNNTADDSWSIHELHAYDGARELSRDGWKLNAQPYPWGIQKIADHQLNTYWLCGETLQPGQFVQADFGQTEDADTVVIETAPNQLGIRLSLEGQDASGAWWRLASEPRITDVPAPPDLRRSAALELKRRGIDYLLFFDNDFGAEDVRLHQDLWGVRTVGEYKGARLYQLP